MAGLQSLLEDYRNWNKTQDWKLQKQREEMFGGDYQLAEDIEKWGGGFGPSNIGAGLGGLAGIVSKEGLEQALSPVRARGIEIEAAANPSLNRITLSKLLVPEAMRGQGLGTQAMRDIGRYADEEQALMQLTPSKDFGASSLKRLKDFYKYVGFQENKGPSRDLSLTESMYRTPLDVSYRGDHEAPGANYGAPLHALEQMYPDDIYGPMAYRYYGHGENEAMDREIISKLQRYRNKPDEMVKIYRAVPTEVFQKRGASAIDPGDWVTPSRKYAVEHGETYLGGKYKIQVKMVPAKTLFTDANSPYEFGYDPSVINK